MLLAAVFVTLLLSVVATPAADVESARLLLLDHVNSLDRDVTLTTHLWEAELAALSPQMAAALAAIKASPAMAAALAPYTLERAGLRSTLADVVDMNELYIAARVGDGAISKGSDNVFVIPHIDGPFYFLPTTLVRCLYMIQGNDLVETVFPMRTRERGHVLQTGQALCFDYNRELHYIRKPLANQTVVDSRARIALKLHLAIAPPGLRWAAPIAGHLNAWYNEWARNMFVGSQHPETSWRDWITAQYIDATTITFSSAESVVGFVNALGLAGVAAAAARSPQPTRNAIAVLSHLHYLCYLCAFAFRSVELGNFIRDALLFKSIALAALGIAYYRTGFAFAPALLSGAGLFLSWAAYRALGPELTYFGIELGAVPPRAVTEWPYSTIAHPMIAGSVVAYLALLLAPRFRASIGLWLVAGHLLGYAATLAAETHADTLASFSQRYTYQALFAEFEPFHRTPMNVAAHVFTSFLGVAAGLNSLSLALAAAADLDAATVRAALLLAGTIVLRYTVPTALVAGVAVAGLALVACLMPLSKGMQPAVLFAVLAVGCGVAQDMAHLFTGESTYLSSYTAGGLDVPALSRLALHNVWLLPFVVQSALALL